MPTSEVEKKSQPINANTMAAVFDTNYSSPAIAPAKNGILGQRNPLDAVYRMAKMSRGTKFVQPGICQPMANLTENLPDFHGAKTTRPSSIY